MDWTDKKIFTCPRCKDKVSFYQTSPRILHLLQGGDESA